MSLGTIHSMPTLRVDPGRPARSIPSLGTIQSMPTLRVDPGAPAGSILSLGTISFQSDTAC